MKKKIKFGKVHYFILFAIYISCLMVILAGHSVLTKIMVENHITEYIDEYAQKSANDFEEIVNASEENIRTMGHLSSYIINTDRIPFSNLQSLVSNTLFDGVGFVDMDGIATDPDGNTWNAKTFPYYMDAMNGNTGSCFTVDESTNNKNRYLLFYSPVRDDEKIYGVLFGYYNEDTLAEKLRFKFWNENVTTFFCTKEGNIIASTNKLDSNVRLMDYFINNGYISKEEGNIIREKLNNYEITRFTCTDITGKKYVRVCQVGESSFYLVEMFPDKAVSFLIKDATQIGQISAILAGVVSIVFVFIFIGIFRSQKALWEAENRKVTSIINGTQKLFKFEAIVNVKTHTYEILNNKTFSFKNYPKKGTYADVKPYLKKFYVSGNPEDSLDNYLNEEYLKNNLSENMDKLSFEFSVGDRKDVWGEIHIVCIKRENQVAQEYLISTVDISTIKLRQMIQKRLPEVLCDTKFDVVALIDSSSDKFVLLDSMELQENSTEDNMNIRYSDWVNYEIEHSVIEKERESFIKCTSINEISNALSQKGKYEFNVQKYTVDDEIGLFKYEYRFFDDEKKTIVLVIQNITEEVGMDSLTETLNLEGFCRKAEGILKQKEKRNQYAILHFDIKDFKALNSLFGFEYGNEILKRFSSELKNSSLKPIITCRSMADHFYALIYRENLKEDELMQLCQMKMKNLGNIAFVQIHGGIYNLQDADMSVQQMCDRARIAQRRIQNEYAKPYQVYEEQMDKDYIENSQILALVESAIENQEFQTYYQPIFDAKTHQIVSAEALVRWVNPLKGVISPGIFIPILEEKGYISKIDMLIENNVQSFLENRALDQKKIVPVSMNLSRMDFINNEAMLQSLVRAVENATINHKYFRFEVTESAYVDIAKMGTYVLDKLRSMGAEILLDDFGTGISTLGNLSNQSFDIIKLDMSFIRSIGNSEKSEAIIKNVIQMCHEIGSRVIAEGVETEEQLQFLTKNGCDYIQGYYFSKPLPQEEFEDLLDK